MCIWSKYIRKWNNNTNLWILFPSFRKEDVLNTVELCRDYFYFMDGMMMYHIKDNGVYETNRKYNGVYERYRGFELNKELLYNKLCII